MKAVALLALLVAFFACANAAANFTANPGAIFIAGSSYKVFRHVAGDPTAAFTPSFTIDVSCDATEDCTANGATWTPTNIAGVTVNVVASAPDTVTINPSAGVPDRFKLTFTAPNATSGGATYVRELIVFVTDETTYSGVPSLASAWKATLITNTPSRNLQWSPSSAPDFSAAPYSFVDPTASAIPLYWGNFYEIRLGLVDVTNYCGTNGTWPDNTNDNDVPPTPLNSGWDKRGCANYIEAGDTWNFPAPSQRIPRAGSNGYDTVRPQTQANPIPTATSGPLVWSVRGAPTQSTLSFIGQALPSGWVASCVDAINGATQPSFPCIVPRYNPDPQVWVISATGTQPARVSAIGTSSVTNPTVPTLNFQATPPVLLSQLIATNEFLVTFEWPNIQTAVTADTAAGIPAQPILINRPTCAPSGSFVADDGTSTNVKGINFFPTCEQGLKTTSGCTPSATLLNCLNSTDAANDANTVVNSLIGTAPLNGVWLSQRPLQILPNGAGAAVLNTGNGAASSVPLSFDSRQGTLPLTIGFPLDKALSGTSGTTIIQNYWNFGANGTTNPGVVTIKPRAVIECANTGDCLTTTGGVTNFVSGNLASFFGASGIPTLTVSNANPTATLAFASLPQPTEGNTWKMFFEVQDAVTSATVYPYSSMPYLTITLSDIDITFVNFPPADGNFYITQPQASAPNSYVYQVRIKRSPRSLGLASVTLGWIIDGASSPIQFIVNGSAVTSFVFSEYQTVINFQIYTANAPVGPFTITWTDPLAAAGGNSFLAIPAPATNLFVRANPISVKTLASRIQGPYVGEPFFVELTWSPPAPGTFSVIASGGSLAEGSVTATAAAGDTGMTLGPLTPILPSNIALSTNSFQLPIALRVTDTTTYSVVSVVTVTVYRHSFVVTNAINNGDTQANTITVFTNGEPSQQFCISTNYPIFNSSLVTAADSVSINFASVSATPNIPGLIFTPAAVVLGQGSTRACVTIRADRNFNWDSILKTGASLGYSVNTYLGGSLAGMFQNPIGVGVTGTEAIWDFPHAVTVSRLSSSLQVVLDESRLTGAASTFALGETVQLRVYTDVLPVAGLNYTIRSSGGVSIVASTSGSSSTSSHGRFAPATASAPGQWQAWDVTFNGYAGDSENLASTYARQVTFTVYVSSGDAEFYRSTNPNPLLDAVAVVKTVTVVKRGVTIAALSPASVQLTALVSGSSTGLVTLDHPVVNGLNVTLMARTTNGVASGGLSFSPSSLQFTPGGANSQAFTVTGNLLGTYQVIGALSGADVDWFDLNNAFSDWQAVTVTKRTGPVFSPDLSAQGAITAGVTYGPVAVTFPSPLNLGESVTITPTGSDFTFTPASVTLVGGQSKALFSFTFRSQTAVEKAVVFWQFTGPDAWKYDYVGAGTLRQEYVIDYKGLSINYQGGSIIPGVTHEGYVTLPFAVASDLTVTPLAIGSSISFSPSTWVFSPTTGNVLHFTYTLNGDQAFALSSNADSSTQPSVNGVNLNIVYLVDGTDSALFTSPTFDQLTIARPAFQLDSTYQSSAKIQNAGEQTLIGTSTSGNLYVLGKWSQIYTIHLATPPAAGSVTLTITDSQNVVEFQVGTDTTETTLAALTFSADSYAQHFRFRFVKLLASDATVTGIASLSVSVSGTNAAWYDLSAILNAFNGIRVVPALAFSPIPAIYTDGAAQNLFVALKNADGGIGGAWPFADAAQFTLHIVPSLKSGVVVEPSTLEFSKSQASDPVQSFSIRHSNPRVFDAARSYTLTYYVRFAGVTSFTDITSVVPQDAQNVLLSRYQIIPKFPHVLSYGWQKASFNLSHIPIAHVSFIPRLPSIDGDNNVRGATTPAGRVDFEPAVIVASPGQQVVEFRVKAQPGVDRDNLYYRVDWEVVGHLDDTVNWVESLQRGGNGLSNNPRGGSLYFATWHLASAGVTTVSFVVLFAACVMALVNML